MQNHSKTGEPPWTILKILKWTTSYFTSHKLENPRASAEILLARALNLKRIDLYIKYDQPLVEHELARFKAMIKRRVNREPVAYIVGEKEFWSMTLEVTKDVLIPRPETECLVEAALKLIPEDSKGSRILELGTGSGAITIALASERPENLFFASDRSEAALQVAVRNADRHTTHKDICFFCGNWFSPVKEDIRPFDMILSNPPYIRSDVIPGLQPEVRDHEPRTALDGEADGLGPVREIIRKAPAYLKKGGWLLLEIGYDQKSGVHEIVKDCGYYQDFSCIKDYSGNDRVVQMRSAR
jgi:release factor glutamine methyltransferase